MILSAQSYDVIVIGAGGGGLRSAIGAAQAKARTLVICRGKSNRSGATLLAGANISADIACDGETLACLGVSQGNKKDTKDAWFSDIIHEGFYLNNQDLATVYVETAGDRLAEMIDWGMEVHGMEGAREVSVFGSDILDTMMRRCRELNVEFMEDTMFTDLLMKDGQVCGVVCVDLYSGEIKALRCKAVVLATGGAHGIFGENSGSSDLCGEGQAAAMRAGAEMIDMEMVSFCPTVATWPTMYKGNILPYILFSTGYGRVLNKYGKTFTDRYLSKHVERLALDSEWNKMLLSYALNAEIQEGRGTRQGGLYYALDLHPQEIMEELYADLPPLKNGIYADIMKIFEADRSLVIKPAAHYFEGGVRIDTACRTTIPGLFAAGECTGGMFGANRVSAATTEMMVEGAIAGDSAAAFARDTSLRQPDTAQMEKIEAELLKPFANRGGKSPEQLRRRLHEISAEAMPVIRTAEKLTEGIAAVEALQHEMENVTLSDTARTYNREWRRSLELRSMLPVAKTMFKSALVRDESRGVHVRGDILRTSNEKNLYNIVFRGESLEETKAPAVLTRMKPEIGEWSYTEYIEKIVAEETGEEGA